MNQFLRGVVRSVAESFDLPGPVLEIGSYQVDGPEGIIDLRSLFRGKTYAGVDFRRAGGGLRRQRRNAAAGDRFGRHRDRREHVRARPPLLAWLRRGLSRATTGRRAGRGLSVLLPPARLPERLLAIHTAGA